MAEELRSNQHHEDIGFEREDMGARNVYAFLIALALMGVLVHFVVKGIYGFMDSYEKAHQPPANPLATATETTRRPEKISRTNSPCRGWRRTSGSRSKISAC